MDYEAKFANVNMRDESRLKSRVPESTSQLIPNLGKTGVNGGPKCRHI